MHPLHYVPKSVRSADALLLLAQELETLAKDYRERASVIRDYRQNGFIVDDKISVIKAARRALTVHINGGVGASECRDLAHEYWLDEDAVIMVFERFKRNHERDQRDARNRAIIKQRINGVKVPALAKRYGLSKGSISKITRGVRPS